MLLSLVEKSWFMIICYQRQVLKMFRHVIRIYTPTDLHNFYTSMCLTRFFHINVGCLIYYEFKQNSEVPWPTQTLGQLS